MTLSIDDIQGMLSENNFHAFRGKTTGKSLEIVQDLKLRFLRFELQLQQSINLDKIQVLDSEGKDLLQHAKILVSSQYNDESRFDGTRLIQGEPTGGVNFHSKNEVGPWLIIDLGKVQSISKVIVTNRNDHFFYRSLSLLVRASNDLCTWHIVFDNWAYKKSKKYLALTTLSKAMVDAAAFDESSFRQIVDKLIKSDNKRDAGEYVQVIEHFLNIEGVAFGPHGLTQTFKFRSDNQVNAAYDSLSKFLRVLNNEFKVKAFASSGTLLGLVREGELLEHDDDLDVCYISNESAKDKILEERESLISFLRASGYEVSPSNVAHLWVKSSNGIMIDLFTGWIEQECCFMNPLPKPGVKEQDITPIQYKSVKGYDFALPANPEPLLVLNYGPSWRNPDPLWRFDWSHARKDFSFLYF